VLCRQVERTPAPTNGSSGGATALRPAPLPGEVNTGGSKGGGDVESGGGAAAAAAPHPGSPKASALKALETLTGKGPKDSKFATLMSEDTYPTLHNGVNAQLYSVWRALDVDHSDWSVRTSNGRPARARARMHGGALRAARRSCVVLTPIARPRWLTPWCLVLFFVRCGRWNHGRCWLVVPRHRRPGSSLSRVEFSKVTATLGVKWDLNSSWYEARSITGTPSIAIERACHGQHTSLTGKVECLSGEDDIARRRRWRQTMTGGWGGPRTSLTTETR
jgi:hypothetical protein